MMTANLDFNKALSFAENKFARRIYLYQLVGLILIIIAAILLIKYFSPIVAMGSVILVFVLMCITVQVVKNYRLRHLIRFLEELVSNGFYVHAFYLATSIKPLVNDSWIETFIQELRHLANISSDEEPIYTDDLYDNELDNIISLIDFNIDIYQDFYLNNKMSVDSYAEQLDRLDDSTIKELETIYNEQKATLDLEQYRLEAFAQIKQYLQSLKKEQIKQMFNVSKAFDIDRNYGRFINKLLDRAVYSAEARAIIKKVYRAKSRFYEVFPDVLKASTKEEIMEKLNYLFSS